MCNKRNKKDNSGLHLQQSPSYLMNCLASFVFASVAIALLLPAGCPLIASCQASICRLSPHAARWALNRLFVLLAPACWAAIKTPAAKLVKILCDMLPGPVAVSSLVPGDMLVFLPTLKLMVAGKLTP